jgi:putative membrane protein
VGGGSTPGTATSFIVGFKNAQTYNRTVEAQQVWTSIASLSRYWGTICRELSTNPRSTRLWFSATSRG